MGWRWVGEDVGGKRVERPGETDMSQVNEMGYLISNNMDFERVFGARIEGGTHNSGPTVLRNETLNAWHVHCSDVPLLEPLRSEASCTYSASES